MSLYKNRLQLQQGISILGAGVPLFDTAVNGLMAISSIFAQEFGDNFIPYSCSNYEGSPVINASNRYFSARKDVSVDQHLVFPRTMDPNGVLQSLLAPDNVYAPDNVVEYYRAVKNRYVFRI